MQWLVRDHRKYGLTAPPETFPKQPNILPGQYGNWLRIPGRHHSREHWSRVWNGSQWLDGKPAILHILSLTGSPEACIPEDVQATAPAVEPQPQRHTTPLTTSACGGLQHRIMNYMTKLPNLSAGQGRDDIAYNFAAFLSRDLQLPDDVALAWLNRWDAKNNPPKGRSRLSEILANARAYGRRPVGSGCSSQSASLINPRHRHGGIVRMEVEI
jgi:hypothetical protein